MENVISFPMFCLTFYFPTNVKKPKNPFKKNIVSSQYIIILKVAQAYFFTYAYPSSLKNIVIQIDGSNIGV